MRLFAVATIAVVAVASCGGRAGGVSNSDAGPGADAAGVSGSSGGGASGSSASGSSGAGSSSGSGGSGDGGLDAGSVADAGASGCKPLPGCSSTTTCPAGDGCNACTCQQGIWQCTGDACPGDSGLVNQDCPQLGPDLPPGTPCTADIVCNYLSACLFVSCECQSGDWSCHLTTTPCKDSGPSDNCPPGVPDQGSSCWLDGTACPYETCPGQVSSSYDTNCLCVSGQWDCATLPGCDAGGP